jgi:hypothetical protein
MRVLALCCLLVAVPFSCVCIDDEPVIEPPGAPATPVRRLTAEELNRTLRDLFPESIVPVVELTEDRGHDFAQETQRQVVADLFVDQLRAGVNAVSAAVVADTTALLPRQPEGTDDEATVVDDWLQSFLVRAFRRPVDDAERRRYVDFFVARREAAAGQFGPALELTLQAILQAPSFLYRLELNSNDDVLDEENRVAVTSVEMATRLSYFLWGTMPDAELLQAGIDGTLSTTEGLQAQTQRLLNDPRFLEAALSFHRQWLDFDRILVSNKSAERFANYNEFVRQAMRREADQFIALLLEKDPTLRALLTSRQTRILPGLNSIYGTSATVDDEEVTLPAERSGVLTQAWFLAARGHALEGSPVLRGVSILERIVCEPPGTPGGAIDITPPSPDDGDNAALTNRERYRRHSEEASCMGCHKAIDGVGFGLEAFDSIGQYRTVDNGQPVDASGTLDGTKVGGTYNGAVELGQVLANSRVVHECVARQWFRFATGRRALSFDADNIAEVTAVFSAADTDLRTLLSQIVLTDGFRLRKVQ